MKGPFFIVIVGKIGGMVGYSHKNIGAPQDWIVGPGQTCGWYRLKKTAQARADELNKAALAAAEDQLQSLLAELTGSPS